MGDFHHLQEESLGALSQILEVSKVPKPDTDFRKNKIQ